MDGTLSEKIFHARVQELGYEIRKIPETDVKTPDFEIIAPQGRIIAEVKELTANQEDVEAIKAFEKGEIHVHSSVPGERVRKSIRSATKQLRSFGNKEDTKLLVIMENIQWEGRSGGFFPMTYTAPWQVDFAMFGFLTVTSSLTNAKSSVPDRSGGGRTTTQTEKTYLSAVCVISNSVDQNFIFYHNPFAANPMNPAIFPDEKSVHLRKPDRVFENPQVWERYK